MSFDPTVLLTAYIDNEFQGPEYSNSDRAALFAAAYDATPTTPPEDYYNAALQNPSPAEIVGILTDCINTTQFKDLPPIKFLLVWKLAEYAAKLAWQNGGAFIPSGPTKINLKAINQVNPGETPTFLVSLAATGIVVSAQALFPGKYTIQLTGLTVTSANQVAAIIQNGIANSSVVFVTSITSLGDVITISFWAYKQTYDPTGLAPTTLTETLSDGLVTDATMIIEIAPNP